MGKNIVNTNLGDELLLSSETSLVNYNKISREELRTKLVFNERNKSSVLYSIEKELGRCNDFWLSVAFINDEGLSMIKGKLNEFHRNNPHAKGKILTSKYLHFNNPDIFEELLEIGFLEVRIVEKFHSKGFLFSRIDEATGELVKTLLVGSSNLTGSGLKDNKEWNLKVSSLEDGEIIKETDYEFKDTWAKAEKLSKKWIKKYRSEYKKKHFVENLEDYKELKEEEEENKGIEPNDMQEKALESLVDLRNNNENKALLISATGTGKTYLSALDVKQYKPKKMLFLVHREQILKQAEKSFKRVIGKNVKTGFFTGNKKDKEAEYLFSTVQTMSKKEVRTLFDPEEFEYIIIDETHKAGAKTYEKILNYFKPSFLLGMTATPERTDGKDIFSLFDHNIAQELRLKDAMEADLLCPFRYYGIMEIFIDGKLIDEKTSLKKLTSEERVKNIIEQAKYYGYSGDRVKGLVFCSRKDEAEELSKLFNKKGYNTEYLTGKDSQEKREAVVSRLVQDNKDDSLDYIFTVDIFNEGIDIPEVNQIIMLRETQSSIVFIQQLGRGLRKDNKKDYVVVLDFIGNYEKNYMIPIALSGDNSFDKDILRKYTMEANNVIPGNSTVYFDEVAREKIYESIEKVSSFKKMIAKSYRILKMKLGRVPYLIDFYENNEIKPVTIINAYGSYHNMLMAVEKKDYQIDFDDKQEKALEYLSETLVKGVRPSELIMLQQRLTGKKDDYSSIRKECKKLDYVINKDEFERAEGVLRGEFTRTEDELVQYSDLENTVSGLNSRMKGYVYNEKTNEFNKQIEDLVQVGLKRYSDYYENKDDKNKFKMYKRYSRKDVCFLMNLKSNQSGTMYGKATFNNESFVFVTYKKEIDENNKYPEGKPDYADRFENPIRFHWESKIGMGIDSEYVKSLEQSSKKHLFVQKNAKEEFCYLGTFEIDHSKTHETTKMNDKGVKKRITEMQFIMNNAVKEDYYIDLFES